MLVQAEVEELQDMNLAKDIAETLHAAYPGHLWAVTVNSGVAVVKDLFVSSVWGMVLHYNNIKGDAAVRKKRIIMAGGELLERANMKRGAYTGERVIDLDGADNYSPLKK